MKATSRRNEPVLPRGRASYSKNDKIRSTITRLTALSITLLTASVMPSALMAQEKPTLEEVIITGSHIQRQDNYSSSSPMMVLDGETIGKVGDTQIGDFLARVPSIISSNDATSTAGNNPQNTGLNTTSLRNLGTSRTLVLVNGRRFVSGTSAGAGYGVDLNAIPTSIIERVDVLTGNQSAVYGSDAIAGVVNIITKTDFEGVQLNVQAGQASEGDREQQNFDITLGRNFGDGNNAWFSFGYTNDEGVVSRDRSYAEISETSIDTDGDGLLDTLAFEGSSFIPESRLIGGGLSIKGNGTPFRGERDLATTDRLNFYDFATLLLPTERKFAAGGLTLNLSEKSTATLEINYTRVESSTKFEPLPFNAVNEAFNVNRGGTSGIDLATHPLWAGSSAGNQFLAAGLMSLDELVTFRRVVEFGQLGAENTRTTFRIAGSVDYEFDNGMLFDLSGTYGLTDQSQANFGDINVERAALALDIEPDGLGGFQCASPVARTRGCVPYNPFNTVDSVAGQAGVTGFSPAAIDYLSVNTGLEGKIEQTAITAILSGELPLSVGDQGNIALALGAGYRKEEGEEVPDGLRQAGLTRILTIQETGGDFDVVEVFGELQIPLLEQLNLDLAARAGDYSTVGNITTWKVGLDAPINKSIRLRATTSTAIRAPNISDLFAGRVNLAGTIFDPCNGVDAAATGNIADNCRSIAAVQNRVATEGAFDLTQVESQGTRIFRAGSPTVEEETATSFTVGAVFTPQSWENFSLAFDYYNIEIEDAIKLPSTDAILTRCHDTPAASFDSTCGGLIVRDVNSGPILGIDTVSNNEDTIETSGLDLEASYFFDDLVPGDLQLSLAANFLTKFEVTGITGDVEDLKGEVLYPEFRATVNIDYTMNDFNVFAQLRYRDETVDRNDNPVHNDNLNSFDSEVYVDLRGSYQFNDSAKVYIGAKNLFDKEPPSMGFSHKYLDAGTGSNGTAFDAIGRQIYAGVNVNF